MNQQSRIQVLCMLANLRGGSLNLDMYEHPAVKDCSLSKDEVVRALKGLHAEGLVASIYERLDGPLFTLSKAGREAMASEGFEFDGDSLRRTQELFNAYFCKTPV